MYQIWSIKTGLCNSVLVAIKHIFNKQVCGVVCGVGRDTRDSYLATVHRLNQLRIFPAMEQMSENLKFCSNWLLLAFTIKQTQTVSLDTVNLSPPRSIFSICNMSLQIFCHYIRHKLYMQIYIISASKPIPRGVVSLFNMTQEASPIWYRWRL